MHGVGQWPAGRRCRAQHAEGGVGQEQSRGRRGSPARPKAQVLGPRAAGFLSPPCLMEWKSCSFRVDLTSPFLSWGPGHLYRWVIRLI